MFSCCVWKFVNHDKPDDTAAADTLGSRSFRSCQSSDQSSAQAFADRIEAFAVAAAWTLTLARSLDSNIRVGEYSSMLHTSHLCSQRLLLLTWPLRKSGCERSQHQKVHKASCVKTAHRIQSAVVAEHHTSAEVETWHLDCSKDVSSGFSRLDVLTLDAACQSS